MKKVHVEIFYRKPDVFVFNTSYLIRYIIYKYISFQQLIAMPSHFILAMLTMFVVAYINYNVFYVFRTNKYIVANANELHNEQH